MRILHESSLEEYSTQFWHREEKKNPSHPALDLIRQGSDPTQMLKRYNLDFKLPRNENGVVRIVELNEEDVENLVIHEYMVNDCWMCKKRGITVESGCRKLKDLALAFHEQRYFERDWDDTQIKCYQQWKEEKSLEGKIRGPNRTLIEQAKTDMYEIVDGWGRLLPYVTLIIKEGFEFYPVETFLACSK